MGSLLRSWVLDGVEIEYISIIKQGLDSEGTLLWISESIWLQLTPNIWHN